MEKEIRKQCLKDRNFFDEGRFMASSLPNLVDNLAKGIHKTKCKHEHHSKNGKRVESNTKFGIVFLNTQTLKII